MGPGPGTITGSGSAYSVQVRTSADQTIVLLEYFLASYNIDRSKVYANGYSGGGETMSIVMGKCPELFTAYLWGRAPMAEGCADGLVSVLPENGNAVPREDYIADSGVKNHILLLDAIIFDPTSAAKGRKHF